MKANSISNHRKAVKPTYLYEYKCKFNKGDRCDLWEHTGICENANCIHHEAMTERSESRTKWWKALWATYYTEQFPCSPYVRKHSKRQIINTLPVPDSGAAK